MEISYEQTKLCSCYENLVKDQTDRIALKRFTKLFNQNILSAVLKTHKKLIAAPNASIYNLTASTGNKIELKSGSGDKDPLIMKVRVQDGYRKFFHFVICNNNQKDFCLKQNWIGQFKEVKYIHVFEVNNHNYKNI